MHDLLDPDTPAGRPALTPASLERFDPFAIWWGKLTDQQRQRIGVAGLLQGLALAKGLDEPGWAAAGMESERALQQLVTDALASELGKLPLPSLDSFGVRSCALCGCTDACGCPEGCHWVMERLCSSCYPAALAAAHATPAELLAFVAPGKGVVADDDATLQRCLDAGLALIYSGAGEKSAWAASPWGKVLREALAAETADD